MAPTDSSPLLTSIDKLLEVFSIDEHNLLIEEVVSRPISGSLEGFHIHESWEFKIVLSGRIQCHFPDKTYHLESGQLLLIPPKLPHLPNKLSPYREKSNWLTLTMNKHETYIYYKETNQTLSLHRFSVDDLDHFHHLTSTRLDRLFQTMWEHRRQENSSLIHVNALFRLTLSAIRECIAQPLDLELKKDSKLDAAIWNIHTRYHHPNLCAADIAKSVGLSTNHLGAMFKKHKGTSLRQFLIEYRLEKAEALLMDNRYSVKQVAFLTGWSNQLYFSKVFHKKFGFPPSRLKHA